MTPVQPKAPLQPDLPSEGSLNKANDPRGGGWAKWFWAIVIAALVVGGVLAWKQYQAKSELAQETGGGRHGGHGGGKGPVPVLIGQVESQDVPMFLNGLGIVQAYNNVTVRARVEGELQGIYFKEGQEVKQGDLLAQIDPRTYQAALDQAKAKMMQDQAQLANANSILARNEQLLKTGVLDRQSFDTQKYSADQLTAAVAADKAAMDSAQTQLDYTHVTAPIAGRVGIRQIDVGNIIRDTDTSSIVVINQIQPISVVFTLPQQDLGKAREALISKEPLKVLALDRDNLSTLAEGQLEVLDNLIDSTTATVKLKAVFPNTDYKLWPGQFVNVRLLLGIQKDALTVPAPAVQRGPNGTYVYVVADNQAKMQDVTIGSTEDGRTVIAKGLTAGQPIVTDGQYRLQEGSRIEASKPEDVKSAAKSDDDSTKP
ncbi:efflux RND transporter periplasmic adaptor subunit [soil metagenome]